MKKLVTLILALMLVLSCAVPAMAADLTPTGKDLKALVPNNSKDLNASVEAKVINEVTGYNVTYDMLPSENSQEVLMMTLAGGSDYDFAVTNSADTFKTLMANGALAPLNEAIDAIAPELWDCVKPIAWKAVSDEAGNVYALAKLYTIQYEVTSAIACRSDLMAAAGITELPKTLSELKDTLVALKEYYGDEYIILAGPYNKGSVGNKSNIPLAISCAFGIYNDWMVDENGKVIYMTEHENFDDMIAYMKDLYDLGLLDVDYASDTYTDVDEKFASGKAIMAFASRETNSTVMAALQETGVTLDDVNYIGVLRGDDGKCVMMSTSQMGGYTFVPAANADSVPDFINFFKKKVENQEIICIGEEGVHFEWAEDGYPVPIQPAFTDERNLSSTFTTFAEMESFQVQFAARLRKNDAIWKLYTQCTLDAKEENADIFVEPYFSYNNSDVYASYNSALYQNLDDFLLQLVVGVKDIEKDLDTFKSDWANGEGEAVREALQAWYDANYAA